MTARISSGGRKIAGVLSVLALLIASLLSLSTPASAADNNEVEKSILLMGITWSGYVEYPSEDGSWIWSDQVQASTSCTGWFVSTNGDFVSAGHCVDPELGKESLIKQFLSEQDAQSLLDDALTTWRVEGFETGAAIDRIVHAVQPPDVEGVVITTPTVVQVMDFQPFDNGDVALLRINGLTKETPALAVAPSHPENGDALTAIGFPAVVGNNMDGSRLRASFKTGTASSQQISTTGIAGTEINADISGGMSGGPTIDASGNVLGVNSYIFIGEEQNFNFITDNNGLRSFLKKNSVEFTVASAAVAPTESSATPVSGPKGPVAELNGGDSDAGTIALGAAAIIFAIGVVSFILIFKSRKRDTQRAAYAGQSLPSNSQAQMIYQTPPLLPTQPVATGVQCPKCGTTYQLGTAFCSNDGTPLRY